MWLKLKVHVARSEVVVTGTETVQFQDALGLVFVYFIYLNVPSNSQPGPSNIDWSPDRKMRSELTSLVLHWSMLRVLGSIVL